MQQESSHASGTSRMMREESHLDDMRAAIRGDFERLEERRGGQELMRASEASPPAPEQPPLPEAPGEPEETENEERTEAGEGRRSLLARLLGR